MSGVENSTKHPRASKIILLATMAMLGENLSPITSSMTSGKDLMDKIMSGKRLKVAERVVIRTNNHNLSQ